MKIRQLGYLGAALILTARAFAQDDISFKSTRLADGLYMLEGVGGFAGGNLGLLAGDDGVVLIDDGLEQYTAQIAGSGMPQRPVHESTLSSIRTCMAITSAATRRSTRMAHVSSPTTAYAPAWWPPMRHATHYRN